MILLDTNIFIEAIKENPVVKNEVIALGIENTCTSYVCVAELYLGVRDKKELRQIHKDLREIKLYAIEPAISLLALDLMRQYVLAHKVNYADFLIAATCLHHNFPLYTLNKKDFKFIPGLQFHK